MKDSIDIEGKCPFSGDRIGGAIGSEPTIEHWWPNRLKVELLHQNPPQANPLDDLDYRAAFEALDLAEVKADIKAFLTTSVDWWPSDYGNYGPQMIRMAWHSAGTYRIADGRGGASEGMLRFSPISSWWDNGNIDKSRRLIWPVKQKYGAALSWADLMVLTGNCALEIMGLPTTGFGGGRRDACEADRATYWGPEGWNGEAVGKGGAAMGGGRGNPDEMVTRTLRWQGDVEEDYYDLENPLAASHQALIYVNPEGPNANGNPLDSARDIRLTFGRMAMNDAETVALIAGGHAFGKSHGKVSADRIGPAPEGAPIQAMGMGWQNPEGTGFGEYTMTNGIEGSWTPNPTQWDNDYLTNLFRFDWKKTTSPAGASQWTPVDPDAPKTPDAHIAGQVEPLMMTTADIALKEDPAYREICLGYLNDFDAFTDAFSRAWHKLTHRDMGPKVRYLGPEVAAEDFDWQDPIPARDHPLIEADDIAHLTARIRDSGLGVPALVGVAWGAASTHRDTDKRGGANGARIALAPQKDWQVNNPAQVASVTRALTAIRDEFDAGAPGGKKVSLADLIVLGGCVAVKKAAADAGIDVDVPFTPGRRDTTQELTDVEQFDWLEPVSDGFRNYHDASIGYNVPPEQIFLDRAALLTLSAPEWTALVGGLRVLDTNYDGTRHGVFTDRPGTLTNDFFVNLTSMDYEWVPLDGSEMAFEIRNRDTKTVAFTATRCDLIFGSNAQLRGIADVYASSDGHPRLVRDFVAAWDKVMMLDRFDVTGK